MNSISLLPIFINFEAKYLATPVPRIFVRTADKDAARMEETSSP
jgi:hypothetical protein